MGHPRRRHRRRCPIPTLSLLSSAALLLLLIFASLSLLAPPHNAPRHVIATSSTVGEFNLSEKVVGDSGGFRISRVGARSPKRDLWSSKIAENFYGCSNASKQYPDAEANTIRNRYLAIATSGGLNQQRTGIIDAVVAARILNATLVVPKLDQRSFWKDSSDFAEIFDVNWFISFLSKDVKIIKELPKIGRKGLRVAYTMRVPRKCTPRCYRNRVLPVLLKKHAVMLTKFDYRLANKLDTDLQKLRCRVNYHALRFTTPIQELGDKLIQIMKAKSKHFIALHLRFEPDMLAFSGCYYGGGEKEKRELGAIRKRWKTLHISNPDKERRHGRCPLTPEEVGLMLRALGFSDDVHIYVASGEIYGGEETLAPLKKLFPNFHTKETLASKGELEPFSSFSSRMAALDFIVCDGSDAFVTNNNGNMAKILAGRRQYFGHKRAIRPNARRLYSLFLNRKNMTWEDFSAKVRRYQRGFMGEPKERRPGRGEFHENPSTCICEAEAKAREVSGLTTRPNISQVDNDLGELVSDPTEYQSPEDDMDSADMDYEEDAPLGRESLNGADVDYDLFTKPEESELEEMLSD